MNVLAINPYHGGSHQAFLESWQKRSRHTFTNLTLPAYKWKWRMRHAPITFADELRSRAGCAWDLIFCTDMLNLAEFRGLSDESIWRLPTVTYFHENQLTYPSAENSDRDLHFAFTNLTTCLASDAVWFNSEFHRSEFLSRIAKWMTRMPDYRPDRIGDRIKERSAVRSPGIERCPSPTSSLTSRRPGPLRILWVARWEVDKNPRRFFEALDLLDAAGGHYRVSVLGESFRESPACFAEARQRFASRIDHWGFVESRQAYQAVLSDSDVVVSTADHEFFGIAILEAVAAGCFPLVPRRLAYPEVLGDAPPLFHDDTAPGLARRLGELSNCLPEGGNIWASYPGLQVDLDRYDWDAVATAMDAGLEEVVELARVRAANEERTMR